MYTDLAFYIGIVLISRADGTRIGRIKDYPTTRHLCRLGKPAQMATAMAVRALTVNLS